MRLLEMLAMSWHDMTAAVYVYTRPGLLRGGQCLKQRLAAFEVRPTDLMHENSYEFQQYPNAIADIVGY